jgi:hypothetical protein
MMHFETLDEREIIKTIGELRNRIAERFPTRGLMQTATHLLDVSRVTAAEASALRKPNWSLRLVAVATVVAGLYGFYKLVGFYEVLIVDRLTLTEFTQGLEASLNILLICGLVVAFFVRLESRYKRLKALNGLHRLRAISHVIDMHQLTKDPASILVAPRTGSSPRRDLSRDQLLRYLDYCTEMLSLTGKLAALYAQNLPDDSVIAAVNDVENLTTSLSRKIWQKIVIIKDEPQDVLAA